ncbi:vanW like family protein [Asticcacaulis biprosthecium C19]|uniref:VanW like family protein n=1 Tax=Asticcacaulis biprosthecium C19 TaxID=715226 RepID=F4QTU2_9CAUL|nr:VanW family protein [Asticcacaulis biprosthecium]EGF89242.1 vanW like family protein [Asticcacaulis biprosthecium C19]
MEADHTISRTDMAVFAIKSTLLKLRRVAIDLVSGVRRWKIAPGHGEALAEVVTPLWSDDSVAERGLQLGKVENLRIAARSLNGLVIPAGQVFSFWAQIGPPTRARGFVEGRELRQGCLIPTVAGGLCQMSNSLHVAAKRAGCAIVERHGHTAAVPGSPFGPDEDATVFWNYVDLRFRAVQSVRLRVVLTEGDLQVVLARAT